MRRAWLFVGVLCALVVSACGGSALSPEAEVAQAATTTAEARSYRASFRLTTTAAGSPSVTMTGAGVFDQRRRVGRMTFDLGALAAEAGQDLGRVDTIYRETEVYVRVPFLQRLRPSLKPWIRFDLEELAKEGGLDLGQLSRLQQADPREALAYLRGVSGEVTRIGEERVRGVETTHYRMTVELRKVAQQAPAAQRAEVTRAIERLLERTSVRRVPTEVWVDEEGLVRRLVLEYRAIELAPGQRGRLRLATELYDFGVDVDVQPPPASEVTDVHELLRS